MSALRKAPGRLKGDSMSAMFVIISATVAETRPSTGGSASGSAWRRWTRRSVSPLARAVRSASSSATSKSTVRVMR